MKTRVLMIDDDVALARMLAEYLASHGLQIETRAQAGPGLELLAQRHFDALILDVMLPDLDGLEACRRIRMRSEIPILMLTARGEDTDRIVGLELGADDYLPKPFNPRELLARLRSLLRRSQAGLQERRKLLHFGRLEIDRDARTVRVDGEPRSMTSHQFELLWVLAENAGRVLSRDQLMHALKGRDLEAFDRSIDTHIARIRAAIEDNTRNPRRVLTIRGAGYVLARHQDGDRD